MKPIVNGKRIVDNKGRQVIYNGINIVWKGQRLADGTKGNYTYPFTQTDIVKLKNKGFNLVRFGIVWDAIEPQYHQYNEEYLQWIEEVMNLCHANDIAVFLDMHQDLYSVDFDGGAPQWATITDGAEHTVGEIWSDSYLYSEAVNTAFRNFWSNRQTEHGVGLIDHYLEVWTMIINRFKSHPALIGYDFINEPFSGEHSLEIFGTLLFGYAKLLNIEIDPDNIMELYSSPESKIELLNNLNDQELYKEISSYSAPFVAEFAQGKLREFYNTIASRLREITTEGLVFTENCYFANLGIPAATAKVEVANKTNSLQVYSPHGYDLVVDSPLVKLSSDKRIEVIIDAHKQVADNLKVPVIFGEWGAHYDNQEALDHIKYIINRFDSLQWSHTYFCWDEGIMDYPIINILSRPYPQRVNGIIDEYKFDWDTNTFTLKWSEDNGENATLVYVPSLTPNIETELDYKIVDNGDSSCIVTLTNENKQGSLQITLK